MAALIWPVKDPDEIVWRGIDWSADLDGSTITSSTWIIDGGVEEDSKANTSTTTRVLLSGGTLGETCLVTNRITTAVGETLDQTCKLKIKVK